MEGEGQRVAPSRAKSKPKAEEAGAVAGSDGQSGVERPAAKAKKTKETKGTAVREPRSKMPLLVIANSPKEEAALAGLERWKEQHVQAAAFLAVDDVLVDRMRGRSTIWYRIRVNLRHVPEELRPAQATPDPDDDPTREGRTKRSPKEVSEP
jgi:hypothetical protein